MAKKVDRHLDRLYKAVANYVEKRGGKVVVIGGVQVQEWPGDLKFNFTIGIKCTGRRPQFAASEGRGGA